MDAETADNLKVLLKHFLSLSPTTPALIPSPPFPSPEQLSLPTTQEWLINNFLPNESEDLGVEEELGAAGWRRVFWRRVERGLEDGFVVRAAKLKSDLEDEEVNEKLLFEVVKYLPASLQPPNHALRTYCFGPLADIDDWKRVQTWEEGKIITAGTTGLRVWHACIALANHLLARPSFVTSATSILELGAGVGLLSLVMGRLNQSTARIVATDVDSNVLERLTQNITLNGLETNITVSKLDWDWNLTEGGRQELEKWEKTNHEETFRGVPPQLIIGADIVYDPSLTAQLAATLAFFLRDSASTPCDSATIDRAKGGVTEALIAATIRHESTWTGFLTYCHEQGLETEILELLNVGKDGVVGAEGWEGEGEVRLVRITRRQQA
ncbi:protein-lysine N-methyltransferase EEF2KMT, partial [Phenoliferia sp. Uapishka_3]